jgi:hypothetical protein
MYHRDISPETQIKARKNLLYLERLHVDIYMIGEKLLK